MTSNHENIFDFKCVTSVQKALLRQCQHKPPFSYVAHSRLTLCILIGRINRFSELILTPASELSRRSKRPLAEIDHLVDNICKEYSSTSLKLDRLAEVIDNKFSGTGPGTHPHIYVRTWPRPPIGQTLVKLSRKIQDPRVTIVRSRIQLITAASKDRSTKRSCG